MIRNKNGSWIKLYRKIRENGLWYLEPFTKAQAWIDLLIISNQKRGHISVKNGELIPVERGQCGHSLKTLAKTWRWSIKKVKRFISFLQREDMVAYNIIANHSIITIKHYREFQDSPTNDSTNVPTDDSTDVTTNDPTDVPTDDLLTRIEEERKENGIRIKEERDKRTQDNDANNSKVIEIIEYLNKKTEKNFPIDDNGYCSVIIDRLKDGFSLDDFKLVIDNKTSDWLHNPKYNRVLTPTTLFGKKTKFIDYLNENPNTVPKRVGRQITSFDDNDDKRRSETADQNTTTID